jgi:hypothetical protein
VLKTVYRLAGLHISSEIPLSGLVVRDRKDSTDVVTIRYAHVPKGLANARTVMDEVAYDGKALLLAIPDVARFLIREGTEILVDPETSADQGDIRAYLLGSAFGALCYQRGILPLHSAAIDGTRGCVAFIGPSGAGKSTLAAVLAARGHQVIADDVSFLRRDNSGSVMSWPGILRIRLWEDAVQALGCGGPEVVREFRGYNKYLVPVAHPRNPFTPRPLRRIYCLKASPDGCGATIKPTRGAAAIEVLMQNAYCLSLAEHMGFKPAVFELCAAIARQISVFEFNRPLGFELLSDAIGLLEDHMRSSRQSLTARAQ